MVEIEIGGHAETSVLVADLRVRLEGGSERFGRVVQTRLRGAFGESEGIGDLGDGQGLVVAEHQDRPLLRRQPAEATIDLVAVGEARSRVVCGRLVLQDTDLGVVPSSATELIGDSPHQRPALPRLESVGIA